MSFAGRSDSGTPVGLDEVVIPSTPTPPVRWGVVATGGIARTVTADLSRCPDVRLAAVASRSVPRAEAFAAEFGFDGAYGDYAALIADDTIDVVYVATPHPDHHRTARACWRRARPSWWRSHSPPRWLTPANSSTPLELGGCC